MRTCSLTFHRGRCCEHHHWGHDRKKTISFLQTLLEIYHSSHIISKIQATVAANTPNTKEGCLLCWSNIVFKISNVLVHTDLLHSLPDGFQKPANRVARLPWLDVRAGLHHYALLSAHSATVCTISDLYDTRNHQRGQYQAATPVCHTNGVNIQTS